MVYGITSVTRRFPRGWRFTVKVERQGPVDKWTGEPSFVRTFDLPDCMYSPGHSDETVDFSDLSDTVGILYGMVKADIKHMDWVYMPATLWSPSYVFSVNGEPKFFPYGFAAPLKMEVVDGR